MAQYNNGYNQNMGNQNTPGCDPAKCKQCKFSIVCARSPYCIINNLIEVVNGLQSSMQNNQVETVNEQPVVAENTTPDIQVQLEKYVSEISNQINSINSKMNNLSGNFDETKKSLSEIYEKLESINVPHETIENGIVVYDEKVIQEEEKTFVPKKNFFTGKTTYVEEKK